MDLFTYLCETMEDIIANLNIDQPSKNQLRESFHC